MPRPFSYMPVMKWKRGEAAALRDLYPADRTGILPLAEVVPAPWDWEEEAPAVDLDAYLKKVARDVSNYWGIEDEILVDLSLVLNDPLGPTLPPPAHPMTFLFDEFRRLKVKATPVIHGNEDTAFQAAVKGILAIDKRGMAIRVQEPLLFDENLAVVLDACIATYGLPAQEIDLILDLLYIEPGRERPLALVLQSVTSAIPHLKDWRSFTLAASSFPKDFAGITDFTTTLYSRSEWSLWSLIRSGRVGFMRTPTFADYAINHAIYDVVDPRTMVANGNIRYTIDSQWLYIKGTIVRDMRRMGVVIKRSPGFGQLVGLAQTLIAHPSYSTPTFSVGDQQADDIANGRISAGNLETWRRIGTNHHVTFVVHQIASAVWPSGSVAPVP